MSKVADVAAASSTPKKDEPVAARGHWGSKAEFILACMGYSVGYGNIWRFPYLCYKNGGGAFLIPYAIALLVAGLPIYLMEVMLGQYSSLGPVGIFRNIAPVGRGIGWSMVVVSLLVSVYYNLLIAWSLFYMGSSLTSELPWSTCRNVWNTFRCSSRREDRWCHEQVRANTTFFNIKGYNHSLAAQLALLVSNQSYCWPPDVLQEVVVLNATDRKSPSEEYFHNFMLEASGDFWSGFDGLSWKLVVSLLAAWVIVFLCLMKGVKSSGKVVYFTALFPYLVLTVLLIFGATLPGAADGVLFYIKPELSKLSDIRVWKDAATQVFFSLGTAFGGLHTMASYNHFKNNCHSDVIIVVVSDFLTSIFGGFVIFAVLGFMAQDLGIEIKNVTEPGSGLAFVAYPEALARMPVGPLWSVLFFFMLVTLGLDSQFATFETVTTAVMDEFVQLRKYKTWVILTGCVCLFLLGLMLCTRSGIFVFTLMNDYAAGWSLIFISLAEVVVVSYVYGCNKLISNLRQMVALTPQRFWSAWLLFWRGCWMLVTPAFLLFILLFSFYDYEVASYGQYQFEGWAESLGWLCSLISVLCVPVGAVVCAIRFLIGRKALAGLFRPTSKWCPADQRLAESASSAAQVGEVNAFQYANSLKI